jgi:hypothetical protein
MLVGVAGNSECNSENAIATAIEDPKMFLKHFIRVLEAPLHILRLVQGLPEALDLLFSRCTFQPSAALGQMVHCPEEHFVRSL